MSGSLATNIGIVLSGFIDPFAAAMRVANSALDDFEGRGKRGMGEVGKATDQTAGKVDKLRQSIDNIGTLLVTVASGVGMAKLVTDTIDAGARMESLSLSIATVVSATNSITEATGRTLAGQDKLNAAMEVSAAIMARIQTDALLTTATTEQLAAGFRMVAGPAAAVGFSVEQTQQLAVRAAQAMGALGIPLEQMGQEIRSILQGDITADSQLAKVLSITNAQIKELVKEGKLFDGLMDTFGDFAVAGEAAGRTWAGLSAAIQDAAEAIQRIASIEPLALLESELGAVLDGAVKLEDGVARLDPALVRFGNQAGKVLAAIVEWTIWAARTFMEWSSWIAENRAWISWYAKAALAAVVVGKLTMAIGETIIMSMALNAVMLRVFGVTTFGAVSKLVGLIAGPLVTALKSVAAWLGVAGVSAAASILPMIAAFAAVGAAAWGFYELMMAIWRGDIDSIGKVIAAIAAVGTALFVLNGIFIAVFQKSLLASVGASIKAMFNLSAAITQVGWAGAAAGAKAAAGFALIIGAAAAAAAAVGSVIWLYQKLKEEQGHNEAAAETEAANQSTKRINHLQRESTKRKLFPGEVAELERLKKDFEAQRKADRLAQGIIDLPDLSKLDFKLTPNPNPGAPAEDKDAKKRAQEHARWLHQLRLNDLEETKRIASERQAALKDEYDRGLITVGQFYQRKKEIQDVAYAKERATLLAELRAAEKPSERARAQGQLQALAGERRAQQAQDARDRAAAELAIEDQKQDTLLEAVRAGASARLAALNDERQRGQVGDDAYFQRRTAIEGGLNQQIMAQLKARAVRYAEDTKERIEADRAVAAEQARQDAEQAQRERDQASAAEARRDALRQAGLEKNQQAIDTELAALDRKKQGAWIGEREYAAEKARLTIQSLQLAVTAAEQEAARYVEGTEKKIEAERRLASARAALQDTQDQATFEVATAGLRDFGFALDAITSAADSLAPVLGRHGHDAGERFGKNLGDAVSVSATMIVSGPIGLISAAIQGVTRLLDTLLDKATSAERKAADTLGRSVLNKLMPGGELLYDAFNFMFPDNPLEQWLQRMDAVKGLDNLGEDIKRAWQGAMQLPADMRGGALAKVYADAASSLTDALADNFLPDEKRAEVEAAIRWFEQEAKKVDGQRKLELRKDARFALDEVLKEHDQEMRYWEISETDDAGNRISVERRAQLDIDKLDKDYTDAKVRRAEQLADLRSDHADRRKSDIERIAKLEKDIAKSEKDDLKAIQDIRNAGNFVELQSVEKIKKDKIAEIEKEGSERRGEMRDQLSRIQAEIKKRDQQFDKRVKQLEEEGEKAEIEHRNAVSRITKELEERRRTHDETMQNLDRQLASLGRYLEREQLITAELRRQAELRREMADGGASQSGGSSSPPPQPTGNTRTFGGETFTSLGGGRYSSKTLDFTVDQIPLLKQYGMLPASFQAFSKGGLTKDPTLALIGERGPELVIPADVTKLLLSAAAQRGAPPPNAVHDMLTGRLGGGNHQTIISNDQYHIHMSMPNFSGSAADRRAAARDILNEIRSIQRNGGNSRNF